MCLWASNSQLEDQRCIMMFIGLDNPVTGLHGACMTVLDDRILNDTWARTVSVYYYPYASVTA